MPCIPVIVRQYAMDVEIFDPAVVMGHRELCVHSGPALTPARKVSCSPSFSAVAEQSAANGPWAIKTYALIC